MLYRDRVEWNPVLRVFSVSAQASPGFEGTFGVFINGNKAKTFYSSNSAMAGPVIVPSVGGRQSVQIIRMGSSGDVAMGLVARTEEAGTADRVTLQWVWPVDYFGASNSASDLSSWAFSGLSQGESLLTPGDKRTRGTMQYSLVVVAGTATLTLRANNQTVASGSASVGGSLTFTGDTVSGSVSVGGGAANESGDLYFRSPKNVHILRGGVDVGTAVNSGGYDVRWTESAALAPATYQYSLYAVSDTDVSGNASANTAITVYGPPEPATSLAYVSGSASNTTVGWYSSPTANCTYNLYVQSVDSPYLDLNDPTAIGSGSNTASGIAITGYPGIARILLRAVKSGVEEREGTMAEIEYDAVGQYVPPRPNTPALGQVSISGNIVSAEAILFTAGQDIAANSAQLFYRTTSGAYNFASPLGSSVYGSESNRSRVATPSGVIFDGPGLYYITCKSSTNGTQSAGYADELLIMISDSPTAPPDFAAYATRS
jgi:hypothetical protein